MTVREKMIAYRNEIGLSLKEMSELCRISRTLLGMVESGDVTHPNIVERIRKVYGLTKLEAEELLPLCRRPHGGAYNPDKYTDKKDLLNRVVL